MFVSLRTVGSSGGSVVEWSTIPENQLIQKKKKEEEAGVVGNIWMRDWIAKRPLLGL
ncbi:hypothetical protein DPMN_141055 [Dreissena polymorpha]|uniref:Uncharacterized protein n=1 Tax=Dreissena polymorpha TaxID=45954 RepID=A0A9D4G8R4_DREPO|nr:hypothetical protein DPMN_141055 [Dreissena polymorpha]